MNWFIIIWISVVVLAQLADLGKHGKDPVLFIAWVAVTAAYWAVLWAGGFFTLL